MNRHESTKNMQKVRFKGLFRLDPMGALLSNEQLMGFKLSFSVQIFLLISGIFLKESGFGALLQEIVG